MTEQLSVQYQAYNHRRLHYSLLFWSSLALEFTGVGVVLITQSRPELTLLAAISCFVMAFIALRLLRQEDHYTLTLHNIDKHWAEVGIEAIQSDLTPSRYGSRKLSVLALVGLGLFLLGDFSLF